MYLKLQGLPLIPGISMTASVQSPNGYSGNVSWIQVIDSSNITITNATGGRVTCSITALSLDNSVPYSNVYQGGTNAQDSPSATLSGTNRQLEDAGNFDMYLMWTPSGVTSPIAVPLSHVTWQWDGIATNNGGTWRTSSSPATYSVSTTTNFPSWNQLFTNGQLTCNNVTEMSGVSLEP